MFYRTTSFSSSNQALRYSSRYTANIQNYQKQISSGLRLHKPSDDPVSYRQVASLTVRAQELRTQKFSISDTEAKLNTSTIAIQDSADLLQRARTLAVQGVQATSEGEGNALAIEVEGLLQSLQGISQTQFSGEYLYSGTRSGDAPYQFDGPRVEGGTLNAEYLGTSQSSRAYINQTFSVETYVSAEEIYGQDNRQEPVYQGTSGARFGKGTPTIVGRATLQVRHTSTTYAGTSGVTAGSGSVTGDTLIGATGSHQLVINDTSGDGTAGTIQLNDGEVISWTNSDTNLRVVQADGEALYVNLSSIAAGFNGTVDLESSGTISVDGGLTETIIDFSASQTVIDSTTGQQVHIDTRSVHEVGDDFLEFPGTSNAFQVLYELASDLRNTRGLDNGSRVEAINRRIGELEGLSDQIFAVLGEQSASLQTLQELSLRTDDLEVDVETQLSTLQSTDVPEAVLRLQNDQSLLEFTYSVVAQVNSVSLLDFLR